MRTIAPRRVRARLASESGQTTLFVLLGLGIFLLGAVGFAVDIDRHAPLLAVPRPQPAAARWLGGSCEPWRLAAVLCGGRLLAPMGPDLGAGVGVAGNTSRPWASDP